MSHQNVEVIKKADISFYNGFTNYRFEYRINLAIHIFKMLMITIFIPIDATKLIMGDKMATSLALALFSSFVSFCLMSSIYYNMFGNLDVRGFLDMAKYINHSTNEKI
jgi:predicted membrane channel-forming protein YqfA (hemolysin III family)